MEKAAELQKGDSTMEKVRQLENRIAEAAKSLAADGLYLDSVSIYSHPTDNSQTHFAPRVDVRLTTHEPLWSSLAEDEDK